MCDFRVPCTRAPGSEQAGPIGSLVGKCTQVLDQLTLQEGSATMRMPFSIVVPFCAMLSMAWARGEHYEPRRDISTHRSLLADPRACT